MNITIRFAKAQDYSSVLDIMSQVQQLHIDWRPDIYKPCGCLIPQEEYTAMCENRTFYVAELEGKVVGVLGIAFRHIESITHVTRDVIFIDTMAVDKEYRGMGIGHLFFDMLKELKKEKKLDGIELQVNAMNRAAYEMYRSCGFREKSINMELPE